MKILPVLFAGFLAMLVVGCSSVSVTTDYDRDLNFTTFKTFQWMAVSKDQLSANAAANMLQNSLVDNRFRGAVKSQLEAKGLTEVSANPNFVIMYHTGTQEKVNVTNYGYGYGRWGGYGGGVDVHQYTQGTLILDFIDPASKQLIWRSVATGALADRPDPETMEQKINGVVQQMLEKFPPAPGK